MGTSNDPANPSMDRPRYWIVKNAAYWGLQTNSDGHVGPISENDLLFVFMERHYIQSKTYEPNTMESGRNLNGFIFKTKTTAQDL